MSDTIKKQIEDTEILVRYLEKHVDRKNPSDASIRELSGQRRRLMLMRTMYDNDTTWLDEWELANDI